MTDAERLAEMREWHADGREFFAEDLDWLLARVEEIVTGQTHMLGVIETLTTASEAAVARIEELTKEQAAAHRLLAEYEDRIEELLAERTTLKLTINALRVELHDMDESVLRRGEL